MAKLLPVNHNCCWNLQESRNIYHCGCT